MHKHQRDARTLSGLLELDGRLLDRVFAAQASRAVQDCHARPEDTKPRAVTLTIKYWPELTADGIRIHFQPEIPTVKLPMARLPVAIGRLDQDGKALLFSPACIDDPDQLTFSDVSPAEDADDEGDPTGAEPQ